VSAVLNVRGLSVSYRREGVERAAVRGVTLELAAGRILALVGESGSGKSTLGLALAGLLPENARVAQGSIELEGRDFSRAPEAEWRGVRGRVVGWLPQDALAALDPLMPIGAQVAEALVYADAVPPTEATRRALESLARAGFSDAETAARLHPHELSGGMRQRALFASALVRPPRVLVADEPTSALDATLALRVVLLLRELARGGTAVLWITHDLAAAASLANDLVVLRAGEVVESGTPARLRDRPEHPYTTALVRAAQFRRPEGAAGDVGPSVALSVRELSVEFEPHRALFERPRPVVRAVRSASFELATGEVLALVGESGSGKSTLARAALGLVPRTGGESRILVPALGRALDPENARGAEVLALRRTAGIVFQDPFSSLPPRLRVGAAVAEVLEVHGLARGGVAADRAGDLLEQVGLQRALGEAFPHELSGGQRQRAAIARVLAAEPSVLVCDEVLSALDPLVASDLLELLRRLAKERGLALLFVTHDLRAARALASRAAVMYAGEIVEIGPADVVLREPAHPYSAALLAAQPTFDPSAAPPVGLAGEPPSASALPPGCAFHPRCPKALTSCSAAHPGEFALDATHRARCVLLNPATR